jgi:hypothetical protein
MTIEYIPKVQKLVDEWNVRVVGLLDSLPRDDIKSILQRVDSLMRWTETDLNPRIIQMIDRIDGMMPYVHEVISRMPDTVDKGVDAMEDGVDLMKAFKRHWVINAFVTPETPGEFALLSPPTHDPYAAQEREKKARETDKGAEMAGATKPATPGTSGTPGTGEKK